MIKGVFVINHLKSASHAAQQTLDFGIARTLETSRGFFEHLLAQTTVYGVTERYAKQVLAQVTSDELVITLSKLIEDETRMREVSQRSYLHPNGFVKLVLHQLGDAKLRLHFWSGHQEAEENIHNHRWVFASKVMTGLLRSELYTSPCQKSDKTLDLMTRLYHKEIGNLEATETECGVYPIELIDVDVKPSGHIYTMNPYVLHRITRQQSDPPTVTLMVQSAPIYEDNYMISFGHVTQPSLSPTHLSITQLNTLLKQIIKLLQTPSSDLSSTDKSYMMRLT
jgi:hypothetical protein